jgi:hypothetical protein
MTYFLRGPVQGEPSLSALAMTYFLRGPVQGEPSLSAKFLENEKSHFFLKQHSTTWTVKGKGDFHLPFLEAMKRAITSLFSIFHFTPLTKKYTETENAIFLPTTPTGPGQAPYPKILISNTFWSITYNAISLIGAALPL